MPTFAKSFDAAAYKGSAKELSRLITEGGVSSKFSIDTIDKDLRVTITIRCGRSHCSITITFGW